MILRLKDELCFVYNSDGIEFYYGNTVLNKLINTENNEEFFKFLSFLSEGKTEKEIKKYNLDNTFKNEIIEYLLNNKYALWEEYSNIKTRTELFINTYPDTNYTDYIDKIKSHKILIIGVGTAGSYVLELLTKLSFSKFTIIDGDIVSSNNIDSQFYYLSDVEKYKVDVLKERYSNSNINAKPIYIEEYSKLRDIILENNFDFIVNCADDFNITKNLLLDKKNNIITSIIIETGYAPLIHQVFKITDSTEADQLLNSIYNMKLLSTNIKTLMRNSGSIFNSWMSAFSISKIIFDHILNFDVSEYGEFDFLQNRYFLGSNYNKDYYDLFSKELQRNMKYKSINTNNEQYTITKTNIFNPKIKLLNDILNEFHINEFLYRKFNFSDFEIYEEYSATLFNLIDFDCKLNDDKFNNYFIDYIKKNYNININDLDYIIKNRIIEIKNNNSINQQLIRKIGDKFIIFNQNYNNTFEKFIGRVHELLHFVFYNITDCHYEHENFVMKNELEFYEFLIAEDNNFLCIYYYYLHIILHKHITNFIALSYEKSIYSNNFSDFKKDNKLLINNNFDSLLYLLNSNVKFDTPFYTLKYFRAFEQNKLNIMSTIKSIINKKEL